MRARYPTYWSQEWYPNTFLVNEPIEIGQARNNESEWNNVAQSGCHFTCLAMIVGLDPAHFAGLLSRTGFFGPDDELFCNQGSGRTRPFVWDRNEPYVINKQLLVNCQWHPQYQKSVTIRLKHTRESSTASSQSASRLLAVAYENDLHVVCGTSKHSVLFAGYNSKEQPYFLEPNPQRISISRMLRGSLTLDWLFKQRQAGERIVFHEYERSVA